jgi:uncharacterized protein YoxC
MDFKFIRKQSLGVVVLLLLTLLLSQIRIFDLFVNTVLGRTALIAFIISISYLNQILGITAVLLIIIMFSNSTIFSLEGFQDQDVDTDKPVAVITTTVTSLPKKKDDVNEDLQKKSDKLESSATDTSVTETSATDTSVGESSANVVTEGFDIMGMERTLQTGKNSNKIPIGNNSYNTDNVSSVDTSSLFSNLFSAF